jgi:phospholipid/cholesterol/gamma-HCH transport system substrate-binding protein
MNAERRALVLFAIMLLVGTAAGLAWYFGASARYTTFEIRTADSVSGLIADSPVEFHGVEVGKVRDVRLLDPGSVRIILKVRRDAPVSRATAATIIARGLATRGFTGYVYIALEDTGFDTRPIAALPGNPYPRIPATRSRFVSLDTTVSEAQQDVRRLTDLLHTVLDEKTVASLKRSTDDLEKVTGVLAANSRKLDTMITSAARAAMNAEEASREVKPLLESSEQAVREIKPLLESSQQVVTALQNQILPETDDAIVRVGDLSASLKKMSTEIERNPAVLIRGKNPPTPGPGEGK